MAWALKVYLGLAALSAPFWRRGLAQRVARGKEDPSRLGEREGKASQTRPDGRLIWVHALGLGEAAAMLVVIRAVQAARPGLGVILTTNTRTGTDGLARLGLPAGVIHQYAPMETPDAVERFLDHWRPEALVVAELDLWPLMLARTQRRGVPLVMVNALMTPRRFRNRRRMAPLMRAMLLMFSRMVVQERATATRLVILGAPEGQIQVGGILKAAASPLPDIPLDRARFAVAVGDRHVWLAAATEAGETETLLAAHRQIVAQRPGALMILAPRQLTDADCAAAAVVAAFGTCPRRSRDDVPGPENLVYLSDSVGEMGLWYRLAPVAFLGHSLSLAGRARLPGKNPFEAAALDVAILHGPDTSDFEESYAGLDAAGGARAVPDAAALAEAVMTVWSDRTLQQSMILAAGRVRDTHQGALKVTVDAVLSVLPAVDQTSGSNGS